MRTFLFALSAAILSACGQPAPDAPSATPAPSAEASTISVSDAWAAPTPGGVDVSAGYLTIANPGGVDDQLIAVSSPRAARVEIHEMQDDNGVMRMRAVPALAVPAGGEVQLAPGGYHLMFFGVTQPFTEGEEIPVALSFQSGATVNVSLPVRPGGGQHGH